MRLMDASDPAAPNAAYGRAAVWVAIAVAASIPRALYVIVAGPPFSGYHWGIAGGLLHEGIIGQDGVRTAFFEPLYPLCLAAGRWLFGDHPLPIQLAQVAIAGAAAPFLYRLTLAVTGRARAAVIAVGLYAGYPLLVHYSAMMAEWTLLSAILIAFASTAVTARTARGAAAAGGLLGLAILTRAAMVPLAVLVPLILIRERRVRDALVLVLATVVVASPLPIHNYRLTGSPWPTRSGFNLYMGNSAYTAAVLPTYNIDLIAEYAASVAARDRPDLVVPSVANEAALDRYYTARAVSEMASRPGYSARLLAAKAAYFFWPRLVPLRSMRDDRATRITLHPGGGIEVVDSAAQPLAQEMAYTVPYVLVVLAAARGAWRRRRTLRTDAVLWAIVATFVVMHALYIPATHYRMPMEFVLFVYAAAGVDPWRRA